MVQAVSFGGKCIEHFTVTEGSEAQTCGSYTAEVSVRMKNLEHENSGRWKHRCMAISPSSAFGVPTPH